MGKLTDNKNITKLLFVGNASNTMLIFRLQLLKSLKKAGYEIHVLAPEDETATEWETYGIHFHHLSIDRKGMSVLRDLKLTWALRKMYRQISPSIIFHYTIKPNIYGSIAAGLAGIKSVAVVTGLGFTFLSGAIIRIVVSNLYRFAFSFSALVWVLNKDDYDEFARLKLCRLHKLEILPGEGIDLEEFQVTENTEKKEGLSFLMIARALKDKGLFEYAGAAGLLKEEFPDVTFNYLGPIDNGNPASVTKEQIDQWHNAAIINYCGETKDVRPYIARQDCVVLPSYREGISRVLLEAAAMGKPIITTDVTGCRDVVDNHENGLLCRAADVTDLSGKMREMILFSAEQRNRMGRNGRVKVTAEFGLEKVYGIYMQKIQRITGNNYQ